MDNATHNLKSWAAIATLDQLRVKASSLEDAIAHMWGYPGFTAEDRKSYKRRLKTVQKAIAVREKHA